MCILLKSGGTKKENISLYDTWEILVDKTVATLHIALYLKMNYFLILSKD